MHLRPHILNRRRAIVLMVVRCIAAGCVLLGCIGLVYAIVIAAVMRDVSVLGIMYGQGVNFLGRALSLLVPGIALAIFSTPIARWLCPAPQRSCPQCGYPAERHGAARCPECGFEFDSAGSTSAPAAAGR
jgi:hypothetical protein